MSPIDLLIRSTLDPKGFTESKGAMAELAQAIKAGVGIDVGRRITDGILAIPGAVIGAVKAGVEFNANIEQQSAAFRTLLGSATAAQQRVAELFDFAATTPFEVGEIIRADKILQSLTGNALAGADGLRLVGDAAAAAGRPFEEAATWIGRLYSGLQSGTPVGEATMRLLEMGLVSGETARKLNTLAESGQATKTALLVIRDTFAGTAGAMELQSKTLNGQLSTLRDNFKQMAGQNTGQIFESITFAVEGLNKAMGSPAVANYLESLRTIADLPGAIARSLGALSGGGKSAPAGTEGTPWEGLAGGGAKTENVLAQTEALEAAIRRVIKSKRDAGEIDMDEAARLAKRLSLIGEIADAEERIQKARDLAANIGRGKPLPIAVGGASGSGADPAAAQQMSAGEKKLADDIAKAWIESTRDGMEARQRLELDYLAAVEQAETAFAGNSETRKVALYQIEETFAARRRALDEQELLAKIQREEEWARSSLDLQKEIEDKRRESVRKELESGAQLLQLRRDEITLHRAMIDADFRTPDFNKRGPRLDLLRMEIAELDKAIGKLREKQALEADPAAREAIQGQINGLTGERAGRNRELVAGEHSTDPNSFMDQMDSRWNDMMSRMGTTAAQAAAAFETVFMTSVNSISNGITGLIMGTQTWGQALRNIGTTIMTTLVNEIVKMGVQWILTHNLMTVVATGFHAIMRLLGWESAAESIAQEETKTPGLATNAALSTASSFGANLLAVAALVAIVGGVVAAMGGFEEGGYTGPLGTRDVAGVVHGQEFVFSAPAVKSIGLDNLEMLHKTGVMPVGRGGLSAGLAGNIASVGGSHSARSEKPVVNVAVINRGVIKSAGQLGAAVQ